MLLLFVSIFNMYVLGVINLKYILDRACFDLDHTVKKLIALALSPLITSWIWLQSIRIFPHQSIEYYIWGIFLMYFALALTFVFKSRYSHNPVLLIDFKDLGQKIWSFRKQIMVSTLCLIPVLLHYLYFPLIENDAIEYFYMAKIITTITDVSWYPNLEGSKAYGLLAPFSHPMGYPAFLSLHMVGLDDYLGPDYKAILLPAKIACVYYPILTVLMIVNILHGEERHNTARWGLLLYFSTPLLIHYVVRCHIDPYRIALMTLSAIVLHQSLIKKYAIGNVVLLGIICGFSWFFHTSGALNALIIFAILCIWVLCKYGLFRAITTGVICSVACLAIVAADLYQIYQVLGTIAGDNGNIQTIRENIGNYEIYWQQMRGIEGLPQKILTLFRTFYEVKYWGFLYIFGLMGIVFYRKEIFSSRPSILRTLLIIIGFFYIIAFTATLIGIDTFVFNARYLMQPIAILIVFGALFISNICARSKILQIIFTSFFLFLGACVLIYDLQSVRDWKLLFASEQGKMSNNKSALASLLEYINHNKLYENGKALVLRKEVLHYSRLPIYHIYDARVVGLAQAENMHSLKQKMSDLGIKYIINTYYQDPFITKSAIADLLHNTNMVNEIYSNSLYDLIAVKPHEQPHLLTTHDGIEKEMVELIPDYHTKESMGNVIYFEKSGDDYFAQMNLRHNVPRFTASRVDYSWEIIADSPTKIKIEFGYVDPQDIKIFDTNRIKEIVLDKGVNQIKMSYNVDFFSHYARTRITHSQRKKIKIIHSRKNLRDAKVLINQHLKIPLYYYTLDGSGKRSYTLQDGKGIFDAQGGKFYIGTMSQLNYRPIKIVLSGEGTVCTVKNQSIFGYITQVFRDRCFNSSPNIPIEVLIPPRMMLYITDTEPEQQFRVHSVDYYE
jgi:hypothetical protein